MQKSPDAFRTISEVATDLDIPQHVLRFWETRFATIRPLKRGGGRRYYRPDDVDLLKGIRQLLYGHGYTIKGVQRILKDDGLRFVQAIGRGEQTASPDRYDPVPDDDQEDVDDPGAAAPLPPQSRSRPVADDAPDGDDAAAHPRAATAPASSALSPERIGRLQSALDELLECERILGGLKSE